MVDIGYVIIFPLVINFNNLFIIQRNDIWMTDTAKDIFSHTGTYYYGLTQGTKYDDDWKYPKNKICCAVSNNTYSALFMFIGSNPSGEALFLKIIVTLYTIGFLMHIR